MQFFLTTSICLILGQGPGPRPGPDPSQVPDQTSPAHSRHAPHHSLPSALKVSHIGCEAVYELCVATL